MRRRRVIAIVGITVLLVVSAGCNGILGPGTDVSKVETGVTNDNVPYIAYNYTVQDYADAILEGPNGEIVAERQLSPETGRSAFQLQNPRSGTYTIAIQEGGETKVTKELKFEGPNPEIVSVNGIWSGPTLDKVQAEIRNTGDLPVQVSAIAVEARGQEMTDSSMYTWLDQNESAQFTNTGSYSETITIEEAGTVEGSVSVETSIGTLQETLHQEFEAPSIEIKSINQEWNGNELIDVETEVRNTGDLPTEVNVTLGNPEPKYYTGEKRVEPHSVTGFDFESEYLGDYRLFRAESGGNHSLKVVADSSDGFASEMIYHEVEGGTVEIESMSPNWEYGELESISFSVANNGETEAETDIIATINGEEIRTDSISLDPGESESYTMDRGFAGPLYSVDSGGEYVLKLSSKDYDTSSQDNIEFDGLDISLSSQEATFSEQYDSNLMELDDVEFTLANRGDITLNVEDITVRLNGASRSFSPIQDEFQPGESTSVSEYFLDPIAVSPGQYELEIEVTESGGSTITETFTVRAE